MLVKQCELKGVNNTNTMICWLDFSKIKIGSLITLDNNEEWWEVKKIYPEMKEYHEVRKTWKVGGLN